MKIDMTPADEFDQFVLGWVVFTALGVVSVYAIGAAAVGVLMLIFGVPA